MKKCFYITTTIPYVNADPHIGFALEIIEADALARFKKQQGYEVTFNTGTDEHGLKIYRKALDEHKDPQAYCDEYAAKFNDLKEELNLSYTKFIRTTDVVHKRAAQEFWKRCDSNGDIYKKNYKSKYCVGCELEKTDSELVEGRCPIHPKLDIEIIEEENYFFRFSAYGQKLLDLYAKQPDFVIPDYRLNEIKLFVERGLDDFSISRLKSKMPWGVPVPGDPDHVMYVWFDALVNYISTIGWPEKMDEFESSWPVVQIAGKDNLRQQSAIWQAMLMSAGIAPSRQIFIHGFITSEGQKMSKSLGNVISPLDLVKRYGVDALRYYLLREIPAYADGDYSEERFKNVYNADLANGLGNLIARVARLAQVNEVVLDLTKDLDRALVAISSDLDQYRFDYALEKLWIYVENLNHFIDAREPWKQEKEDAAQTIKAVVEGTEELVGLRELAHALKPFLPETAEEMEKQFGGEKVLEHEIYFKRI